MQEINFSIQLMAVKLWIFFTLGLRLKVNKLFFFSSAEQSKTWLWKYNLAEWAQRSVASCWNFFTLAVWGSVILMRCFHQFDRRLGNFSYLISHIICLAFFHCVSLMRLRDLMFKDMKDDSRKKSYTVFPHIVSALE